MSQSDKLLKALSGQLIRKRASVFEIRAGDGSLCTEDEIEMLKEIAEGGDPFGDKRKQREQDLEEATEAPPIDLHYSSLLPSRKDVYREALKSQVTEAAKFQPDVGFAKKNPEVHRFLLRVYKMLKQTEKLFEEIPNDPMADIPAAPEDPALHQFQHLYRELKTAMGMLRDHFRDYGDVAPKWIELVKKRFVPFVPVYNEVVTRQGEGSGDGEEVPLAGSGATV